MPDPYNPWATPIFPGDNAPQPYESYASPQIANILTHIAGALGRGFMAPGNALNSPTPLTSEQLVQPAHDMMGVMVGGAPMAERGAVGVMGGKLNLPSSNSLATPPAPTVADMMRASRVESVPLSQARGTNKMQWEKTNAGEHPPPLIEGYADRPVAVRREDGEYLIFDGHHRTVNAMNEGSPAMEMHVINAKDYAPEFAGRKPAPPTISDDDLLKMLRD